jgi:hypothetical protein
MKTLEDHIYMKSLYLFTAMVFRHAQLNLKHDI